MPFFCEPFPSFLHSLSSSIQSTFLQYSASPYPLFLTHFLFSMAVHILAKCSKYPSTTKEFFLWRKDAAAAPLLCVCHFLECMVWKTVTTRISRVPLKFRLPNTFCRLHRSVESFDLSTFICRGDDICRAGI